MNDVKDLRLGRVLSDEWELGDEPVLSGADPEFAHKEKPYSIKINGYRIELTNFITGQVRYTVEKDEFDALCTIAKMGALPQAVLDGDIQL